MEHKGFFMKNAGKIFGIIALIAIIGLTMAGCVTATSIGGMEGRKEGHGLFSGGAGKTAATAGQQEIGSYTTWLGLFDSGYDDFAASVKQAVAAGKKVTNVYTWLLVGRRITAYAQ